MEVFKQETAQNYQSEKNSALAMKAGSMVMPKKGSTFYVVPELMALREEAMRGMSFQNKKQLRKHFSELYNIFLCGNRKTFIVEGF